MKRRVLTDQARFSRGRLTLPSCLPSVAYAAGTAHTKDHRVIEAVRDTKEKKDFTSFTVLSKVNKKIYRLQKATRQVHNDVLNSKFFLLNIELYIAYNNEQC